MHTPKTISFTSEKTPNLTLVLSVKTFIQFVFNTSQYLSGSSGVDIFYAGHLLETIIYMIDSDRRPVSNRRPLLKSASTDIIISNHGPIRYFLVISIPAETPVFSFIDHVI